MFENSQQKNKKKSDTCKVKERRISRAQINHVNKRLPFYVTWQGIRNSGLLMSSAAAALSSNLLIRVLM
jgi:hypothetical protein